MYVFQQALAALKATLLIRQEVPWLQFLVSDVGEKSMQAATTSEASPGSDSEVKGDVK